MKQWKRLGELEFGMKTKMGVCGPDAQTFFSIVKTINFFSFQYVKLPIVIIDQ